MDEWTDEHVLEGQRITVRPMHADDVDRLRRLFFRLSPETIWLRFFQPVKPPSERTLRYLAEVDHDQREAIVAIVDDEIVGVARYDRSRDDPALAEVAIVIEDAWQGHGLGKLLLRRLTTDAVEHGVAAWTATVLGDNRRMLRLAHHLSPGLHSHLEHGEWYLDMPLVEPTLVATAAAAHSAVRSA